MKNPFSITFIVFFALLGLQASLLNASVKTFPGDDKKGKKTSGREDTTKFVVSEDLPGEGDEAETPDTMQILFPSHDLYSSWETDAAHPYNFKESFKDDCVEITLVNECDNDFVLPYKGHLTSVFGWRKYRPHFGTDIDLETGDSVVSCFDGMVRCARVFHGYGNCVIVRHKNGLETVYAHLSKIMVESGQEVNAGTVLGLGGNTGRSYGSHLHFEIRYLGQALDTQDMIDYENGTLRTNVFVLTKEDVDNKYDLRALHNRHRHDVGLAKGGKTSGSKIYRVRQGDTLGAIARRKGTTVKAICRKNGIRATATLRVGQRLKI